MTGIFASNNDMPSNLFGNFVAQVKSRVRMFNALRADIRVRLFSVVPLSTAVAW